MLLVVALPYLDPMATCPYIRRIRMESSSWSHPSKGNTQNNDRADSAIWKISWSHPKYGELIGVASFSKTVSVFQNRNGEWVEVASHNLHEGSVN